MPAQPLLTFDQARQLLGVSPAFLAQAVSKGRLKPQGEATNDHEHMQFLTEDVAKFGELLQKLKAGGITAMLDIADSGTRLF